MMATFEPDLHIYRINGNRVPSVTETINTVCPREYTCGDWYLQRGRAIHAAIHLLVRGRLDWTSIDPRILSRLEAFERFTKETGYSVVECEQWFASPKYYFAGTLDALVSTPTGLVLTDFKSTLEPQLVPQLGGYFHLAKENDIPVCRGLGLELRDDGTYRCQWFTLCELRRAEQTFLALLTVRNWMHQNNL